MKPSLRFPVLSTASALTTAGFDVNQNYRYRTKNVQAGVCWSSAIFNGVVAFSLSATSTQSTQQLWVLLFCPGKRVRTSTQLLPLSFQIKHFQFEISQFTSSPSFAEGFEGPPGRDRQERASQNQRSSGAAVPCAVSSKLLCTSANTAPAAT